MYWLGIPILALLFGIVLVWISKENLKTKLLSTFLALPIILASFSLFCLLLPKAESETFLIPQNFRGQFQIAFDESCGQPTNYENGKRIYQIPDNGVLITKFKQTNGVIDRKFFLVDENGNRAEMTDFHWSNFKREQKDWHWTFSRTEPSKDAVGFFLAYRYGLSFIVSDYLSLESEDKETKEKKQKTFQNTVDFLLKECRLTR